MKYILLSLIFILSSCASTKKVDKTRVHPDFVPYVQNYMINNAHPAITDKIKTGYELKIKYDDIGYAPQYPAYCSMSKKLENRVVAVNPKFWRDYPEKRADYITHLINKCGADETETFYGDIYYRGY